MSSGKRIAKNTLLLYFRMLLLMVISLYTSRIVLKELGVEDFGIYNIVGGIVMKFSALEKAYKEATLKSEREHVTPYIWKNGSADGGTIYKTYNFKNPAGEYNANDYRITIDEPEDFEVIKALIENLGIEKDWKTYIDYLIEHKEIYAINSKFSNNEGYAKSLANDGVYVKK